MSDCEFIDVAVDAGVMTVTMSRLAKKNAITRAMYEAMNKALRGADADPRVRAIIITGEGDIFTSGNDVLDFMNAPPTDTSNPGFQFLAVISTLEKPLIAAVNGLAIGIGGTLLLHCDLAYATEEATFTFPFVNLGLCPEAGSSHLLPHQLGYHKAAEILLLGESFSAEEAKRVGLINDVCPSGTVLKVAQAKAQRIVQQPPAAVRLAKRLMKRSQADLVHETMLAEGAAFVERLTSPEAAEAFTAFLEKRKPDFSAFE